MTPLDLDALERLAKAATGGEWVVEDGGYINRHPCISAPAVGHIAEVGNMAPWYEQHIWSENAAFIAAANPQTVLRLIECANVLGELIEALPSAEFMEGRGLKEARMLQRAREALRLIEMARRAKV